MRRRVSGMLGLVAILAMTSQAPARAAEVVVGKVPLNFSLDFRVRSEYIEHNGFNDADARWRQRLRLRFGVTGDITEHVTAGFRLSTGDKLYPTTAYQTFDSTNFTKLDFTIDRAYVGYKRQAGPVLTSLSLGKFGHPFYTPSEIVWDSDLQPAGAAESFSFTRSGITVAMAEYFLREDDKVKHTGSSLYAGQVAWKKGWKPAAVGLGLAYYNIVDPIQVASDALANNKDFLTNKNFSTCTAGSPGSCTGVLSDFHILNFSGDVTLTRVPLRFLGEYVVNLGAKEAIVGGTQFGKEDTAWLAGVYYGKSKDKGDWRVGGGYTRIEADAVVANFNSDDLQQTNVNTMFTEFRYQLHSRSYIYYDGYYQEKNNFALFQANGNPVTNDTKQYRHRVTLVVEF